MLQCLEGLEGPPFRLHSDVVAPWENDIASETKAIKECYGVDISEDLQAADEGPCVRSHEDMFRYSQASLDWLAEVSGSKFMKRKDGESLAREVAVRMEQIHRRPILRDRLELAKRICFTTLRRICGGH